MRTTSGDISARRIGGILEAATASGNVFAQIMEPLEEVYVRTSSGDVRLILSDPLRGRLMVSTSSGEIVARMPISPETVSRTQLIGVLGPGDATLEVKTSSGDVELLHDDRL